MASKKTNEKALKKQRTEEDSTTPTMPDFPRDLIEEILSRLPPKSLGRFRCVCKSWDALISSPQFLKKQQSTAVDTRIRICRNICNPMSLTLHSLLHQPSPPQIEFDYPLKSPESRANVFASCNGLHFIRVDPQGSNTSYFYLTNPLTREHKYISTSQQFLAHGFGYDGSSDDYKIILFCGNRKQPVVKVYSLRTNSWRVIKSHLFGLIISKEPGQFINGALHWGANFDFESYSFILSFDLGKETFEEFQVPVCWKHGTCPVVRVLEGCLCVPVHTFGDGCTDLWVMNKYGVGESWTKLVTLQSQKIFPQPLYMMENGNILMDACGCLYNAKDGKIDRPLLFASHFLIYPITVFMESLVSLSPNAASGRKTTIQVMERDVDRRNLSASR